MAFGIHALCLPVEACGISVGVDKYIRIHSVYMAG